MRQVRKGRKSGRYCYTDDLVSFNNKRFHDFISEIYPKELTVSETTESTSVASYLDLLFTLPPNYMTNMMCLVSKL